MDTKKIVEIANQIVYEKTGKYLKDIQVYILRETLNKNKYIKIANATNRHEASIKKEGSLLWKLLSEALGEKVTKTNLREALERSQTMLENPEKISKPNPHQDWADAPDVSTFFGREAELATLKQWILEDRCRLV
ncbi:MAG TPA: ATPase, partial [Cyanobacteria bacterium UBA8543]|nr:ATPase [Cyanobacteria bacterium UBA8543]